MPLLCSEQVIRSDPLTALPASSGRAVFFYKKRGAAMLTVPRY